MFARTVPFLAAFSALLSVSMAAPMVERGAAGPRVDPDKCNVVLTGTFQGSYIPTNQGHFVNLGVMPGVKHADIAGEQSSIVITKGDDGKGLAAQQWEFAECPQLTEYDGVKGGNQGSETISFGLLRPAGATKHCLALESPDDNQNPNRGRSVVDSDCYNHNIPTFYKIWQRNHDNTGRNPIRDAFSIRGLAAYVSNTAHKEVQFWPGKVPSDIASGQISITL